ncbi:MAG: EAL domain-containing protein [Planctomycetaceae bacterium]
MCDTSPPAAVLDRVNPGDFSFAFPPIVDTHTRVVYSCEALVRGIESNGPKQAIVRAIAQVCIDLGIDFVVEGVETVDEFSWFTDLGVNLYQGYLFAKPQFEAMPSFQIPELK